MSTFEFNCMTTANYLMRIATWLHYLSVYQARARQDARAAERQVRDIEREQALDIALRVACIVGIHTALAVLRAVIAR